MILFLLYAAFVWYFCFRYRRTWLGFVSVAVGLLIVALLARGHTLMINYLRSSGSTLFDAKNDGRLFEMLLGVEAVIVGVVGIFFACLPRERPVKPCRGCQYELAGLEDANPTCPECGLLFAAVAVKEKTCEVCGQPAMIAAGETMCDTCRAASPRKVFRPRELMRPGDVSGE